MSINRKSVTPPVYEYRVPFLASELGDHNTVIVPFDDKRYIADSTENSILVARVDDSGAADFDFDERGFVSIDMPELSKPVTSSITASIVPQTDGGVIGSVSDSDVGFGLVRLRENGELDSSFGHDGKIVHLLEGSPQLPGRHDEELGAKGRTGAGPHAGVVCAENKTIDAMLGSRFGNNAVLLRCLETGNLDLGFNETGQVAIKYPDTPTHAWAVAAAPDGGAVVAGSAGRVSSEAKAFLARYNVDGSLNTTFGEGGFALFDAASAGIPAEELSQLEMGHVILMADGGYAACGYLDAKNPWRHFGMVIRVDSSGRPLSSFNEGKPLLFELPDSAEVDFLWGGLVEQSDGKLVVAGGVVRRDPAHQRHALVVRFLANGQQDQTFHNEGVLVYQPFGDLFCYLGNVALDHEQNLIIAGDSGPSNNSSSMKGFGAQFAKS